MTAPSASVELEPSKRTVWLVQAMIGAPASAIGRLAHHRGDAVAVHADRQAALVAHGQGDGVDAGLLVGLVRVDDVRAGAVAEVPVVAQEAAVGVGLEARAVEEDGVARADVAVAAGDGDRAGVDEDAGGVDGDGVAEAGAVVDGQRHREDAAARVGVGDDVADGRGRAVAEVPGMDQPVAVGVAGGASRRG